MVSEQRHRATDGAAAHDNSGSLLASHQPEGHRFARTPTALDIHAERRWYAQTLYRAFANRELPPATGRLRPQDHYRAVALIVSRQLGHNRLDIVLRHYLGYLPPLYYALCITLFTVHNTRRPFKTLPRAAYSRVCYELALSAVERPASEWILAVPLDRFAREA